MRTRSVRARGWIHDWDTHIFCTALSLTSRRGTRPGRSVMQSIFGDSEPAMQPSNPVPDPTSIMLLPRTSSGLLQSTCATAQSTGAGGQASILSNTRNIRTATKMDRDADRQGCKKAKRRVCEHKSRLVLFGQRMRFCPAMWYPRTNDGAVPHDHARVNRVRICYIVPSARLGKCAGKSGFRAACYRRSGTFFGSFGAVKILGNNAVRASTTRGGQPTLSCRTVMTLPLGILKRSGFVNRM
jgi:hypothetical protein